MSYLDTVLKDPEHKPTVLLVDDQPLIAEAIRRSIASEEDIMFHYCRDPAHAVKAAIELQPTVILQDLVMPAMDGLTLVKFFRANPVTRPIPIIVLSVKEDPEIKSEAFEAGANDYLVKLPNRIELIARVRYHSRAYVYHMQRDQAFIALQESQRRLEETNRTLSRLSSLDGLTGIANRRRFDEAIEQEWRRLARTGKPLSLIMVDIDHFKAYNDTYGHLQGDECLKTVARHLEETVRRPADMVARYGGEEFTVILPETGLESARMLAEKMRDLVESAALPHENALAGDRVTVSLGVASTVPGPDLTPDDLIEQADKALYRAKEQGRNRVVAAGQKALRPIRS